MSVHDRLEEMGVELPEVVAPVAAYTPAIVFGNMVRTSGQLPIKDGNVTCTGLVSDEASPVEAFEAARLCALNALAAAADAAGGVDKIKRVVKVTGFVASPPGFHAQPTVVNGASEFYQAVFGTQHARSAVGVSALPLDASVEVEVDFEIES